MEQQALWRCPRCERRFANRNQPHTCAPLGDVDRHFIGCEPHVRETFDLIVASVEQLGPVEVLAERSRIALHARMSFAALMPRRRWLAGHLVLAEPNPDDCFHRTLTISPRNHVHEFRLHGPADVDAAFVAHLAAAYAVGRQEHLRR